MDDVISLSSGSEEDSDIELVGSFRDDSSGGIQFIRAELLPVTPVSSPHQHDILTVVLLYFYFLLFKTKIKQNYSILL